MINIDLIELLERAKAAAANAYAPYSGYKVGSAVLSSEGSIFTGCNVENASYSLTICAERNAIFNAVASGQKSFLALAVYVDSTRNFPPCGACRQVMSEFAPSLKVIFGNRNEVVETTLAELLPGAFSLHDA
ncbi:MAG TPA: cytidine deaminase [Candidatus Cloacimonadota bacterium]|nr:cytidine deaminase [Candidatus Cloacimonadota bacterium]